MKKFLLLTVAVAVGVLTACSSQSDSAKNQSGTPSNQMSQSTGQALRIYLDPVTGKSIAPPPGAVLNQPAMQGAAVQPMMEVPAPGGGTMIDMRGRFLTSSKAIVDKNGKVIVEHVDGAASRIAGEK